eukprot:3428631-Alexandrium_andersonii.AAC.1
MLDERSEERYGAARGHYKWAQIYCLLHYLIAAFNVIWPLLAPQADLETHPAGLVSAASVGPQTLFGLDGRPQWHLSAARQYQDLASAWE